MPLLNPDGYEYSRTHQRLWRKNRRRPTSDNQCFGVDLNRNFDVIGFGVGASNQSCSDSYSGPFAASEPEVKAAAGVVMRHRNNIRVSLSLHSYGTFYYLPRWLFFCASYSCSLALLHLQNLVLVSRFSQFCIILCVIE